MPQCLHAAAAVISFLVFIAVFVFLLFPRAQVVAVPLLGRSGALDGDVLRDAVEALAPRAVFLQSGLTGPCGMHIGTAA